MQRQILDLLFGKFIENFGSFFKDCEEIFINRLTISMTFKSFNHEQLIHSANSKCDDIFFVRKGVVAVYETSCYREAILGYTLGAVLNTYQALMDQTLDVSFKTCEQTELMSIPVTVFLTICEKCPKSAR